MRVFENPSPQLRHGYFQLLEKSYRKTLLVAVANNKNIFQSFLEQAASCLFLAQNFFQIFLAHVRDTK